MIVSKSVHGYTPVHKNRKDTNLVKINKQVCIILKPKYHISLYKNVLNRYQHNNISYESIHFLYSVRFPGGESKNRYIWIPGKDIFPQWNYIFRTKSKVLSKV